MFQLHPVNIKPRNRKFQLNNDDINVLEAAPHKSKHNSWVLLHRRWSLLSVRQEIRWSSWWDTSWSRRARGAWRSRAVRTSRTLVRSTGGVEPWCPVIWDPLIRLTCSAKLHDWRCWFLLISSSFFRISRSSRKFVCAGIPAFNHSHLPALCAARPRQG